MSVYLLATLDTKGPEAALVRDRLVKLGVQVTVVDTGCIGEPAFAADVSREQVFDAAGASLAEMLDKNDRGTAVTRAAEGATALVVEAHRQGKLDGVLALGGSAGTTIGTSAMRALPLGVPKLMVSTLASGPVRQYVGDKDIFMLNSVVDIAGINRLSRSILGCAAAAMAGMVLHPIEPSSDDRPLVAATMFGVTTPCVLKAKEVLEEAGYEVLVFHATGNGGQAMESLIRDGLIAGVLDITTTELADELVGGVLSAGPQRLTAAAERGVPQVVSVGATDMVNFNAWETVPERFASRKFHVHNANVTLMRTTAEENAGLGEEIARKTAASQGPAALVLPLRGVSAIDQAGQSFDDPGARAALFDAVRQHHGAVELIELDAHINDDAFAKAAANKLIALMRSK
ncbi:MAG: Tm-1-like ATP-binding domain-containing protein [Pirellulaceae bacterium]